MAIQSANIKIDNVTVAELIGVLQQLDGRLAVYIATECKNQDEHGFATAKLMVFVVGRAPYGDPTVSLSGRCPTCSDLDS